MSRSTSLFSLVGRVVIVTGGVGRLGASFTRYLCRQGARVAVFDLNASSRGGELMDECEDALLLIDADVSKRGEVERGLDQVRDRWDVPQGLVNNAALDAPPSARAADNGPLETYPETTWNAVIAANMTGLLVCSQVVGGAMAREGRGAIVNVGSIYGALSPDQRLYEYRREAGAPFFKPIGYAATKAAVINMTRYMATYWAASGVRVNTLSPGGVFDAQDPRFVEAYCSRVPMGRMADKEEYNGAVHFLLADASAYMTGANMIVDGGWSAW